MTMLAGIIIALKNCSSPFGIFNSATSYVVEVRFVNSVVGSLGLGTFAALFWCYRMQELAAAIRAGFSKATSFDIFGHGRVANWTGTSDGLARRTNLIVVISFFLHRIALATDSASDANPSRVGLQVGGAGNTGAILGLLACARNGRRGFAAFCTRKRQSGVTRPADAVVGKRAANWTMPTFLGHRGNVPQLSVLVKFVLQRLADMGLEPRLI